ncbi:Myosin VIIA, partial [Perkinsus olseni]
AASGRPQDSQAAHLCSLVARTADAAAATLGKLTEQSVEKSISAASSKGVTDLMLSAEAELDDVVRHIAVMSMADLSPCEDLALPAQNFLTKLQSACSAMLPDFNPSAAAGVAGSFVLAARMVAVAAAASVVGYGGGTEALVEACRSRIPQVLDGGSGGKLLCPAAVEEKEQAHIRALEKTVFAARVEDKTRQDGAGLKGIAEALEAATLLIGRMPPEGELPEVTPSGVDGSLEASVIDVLHRESGRYLELQRKLEEVQGEAGVLRKELQASCGDSESLRATLAALEGRLLQTAQKDEAAKARDSELERLRAEIEYYRRVERRQLRAQLGSSQKELDAAGSKEAALRRRIQQFEEAERLRSERERATGDFGGGGHLLALQMQTLSQQNARLRARLVRACTRPFLPESTPSQVATNRYSYRRVSLVIQPSTVSRLVSGSSFYRTMDPSPVEGSEDANHYGVSNNTALVRLDPNSMLRNVQVRYEEAFEEAKKRARCSSGDSSGIQFLGGGGSSIYTWTGSVLLAINPYQQMNVYDVEYVRYHYSKNLNQADPHPFAIASHAYRQLSKTRTSQSIIISGESGAGKTESSKHVMRFLTMLDETFIKNGVNSRSNRGGGSSGRRSTLDDRILGTNPILEAFGNAKTVRNDNSSRFGKLMKLNYTLPSATSAHNAAKPVIKSASIDTYLLARSRVTHTSSAHERSYHIFYLLSAGVQDAARRKQLRLEDSASEYSYLTPSRGKGPAKVRDMDDSAAFTEVVDAFTKLGITEAEQMEIFSVVSAVMKLGNIGLYPDEANPEGKTRTDDSGRRAAEDVAALIGLEQLSEPFIDHLTRQRLVVGGNKDITWADVRASKATTVRDALAKSLYIMVFDYVVELLNEKLRGDDQGSNLEEAENVNPNPQSPTRAADERSICILDIFGFENLARNSLEQLCINFANERLNEYFTENVVLSEREEYHQEHIPLPDLTPPDNRPTINVIGSLSPPGIFEQLRVVTVDYMIRPLDKDYDAILMSRLAPVAAINWRKGESAAQSGGQASQRILKCVGPQHPRLFIVNHYAEPVTYSTEGFVEKNKDCDRNVMDLLSLSSSDFIQRLISGGDTATTAAVKTPLSRSSENSGDRLRGGILAGGLQLSQGERAVFQFFGRPAGRSMSVAGPSRMSLAQGAGGIPGLNHSGAASKKCIASEFAKQVDVLLEDLKATRSHYIRCIKPNDDQLPGVFSPERVFKQLEVTGMFTVLVLMAHAYPTRIPYADLFDRYKSMLPGHILGLLMRPGRGGGARLFVEQMLEVVADEERSSGREYSKGKEFALGTSKVFFRPQSVEPVDSLLAAIDGDVAKRNRVAQAIATSIIRRRRYRQQCYIRTGGRLLVILRRRQNYWKWFHQYFLRLTAIVKFIRRRLLPSVYERRRIRKAAACKIQEYWRARRNRRRREAALIIVSRMRCYLAQKMLKERALRRRICTASAISIQCAWRQRLARRELRRRFNANEEAKRRHAEMERMKELQREKEAAERELREARELIEKKEEESAAVCEALVKQEEQTTSDRENRSMALADWEARQVRDADAARAREEAEKTRLMEERISLEASLAEERARFQAQLAAEKARVEAQMAEEKARMGLRLAEERAAIEAERARNEEEKRRIEAERAQEAAMAETLRQQQLELDREKTELEQAKLAVSMTGPLSSPGASEGSVKREQELLAEQEEEIARLRAEVEAFKMKKDTEMKVEVAFEHFIVEGSASSKRAHSPTLGSVPPAKRSRSNSSNGPENGCTPRK